MCSRKSGLGLLGGEPVGNDKAVLFVGQASGHGRESSRSSSSRQTTVWQCVVLGW